MDKGDKYKKVEVQQEQKPGTEQGSEERSAWDSDESQESSDFGNSDSENDDSEEEDSSSEMSDDDDDDDDNTVQTHRINDNSRFSDKKKAPSNMSIIEAARQLGNFQFMLDPVPLMTPKRGNNKQESIRNAGASDVKEKDTRLASGLSNQRANDQKEFDFANHM